MPRDNSGLRFIDGTQGAGTLNVKCAIGWGRFDTLPTGMSLNSNDIAASSSICRIHVPTISFTSDYFKDIANAPQYSLKYNDYYADTDSDLKQGTTVSRLFNTQINKSAYIIYYTIFGTINSSRKTLSKCFNFSIEFSTYYMHTM